GQRARLEGRRRKRGLAIVDAGLAAPIGSGRHARKRIHSLVLALIRRRRRKVERLVAGETERGVGRCGHLPARDARDQEERGRYGAQAQHSTAMHDVSNCFASVVPTELSCSNRFGSDSIRAPWHFVDARAYAITAVSARDVAMET